MGETIIQNNRLILRDPERADEYAYLNWMTQGEWLKFDAPWESIPSNEIELKEQFYQMCNDNLPTPRIRLFIATNNNIPVGWVSRYSEGNAPDTIMIGIDICEDRFLNKGLGTQALRLWMQYLFSVSTVHRIGLDTWSLNPRMINVAEKLGFICEGKQREVLQWKDKWQDLVHFGILRHEWEALNSNDIN